MSDAPAAEVERPGLLTLASAFNRIALESFGGGLSAWSREIIVLERGWMTDEEFLSASTICRILPGANQVNLAVFVGARLHGAAGAAMALIGLLTVPGLLVLLLGALYLRFRDVPMLRHALSGVAAAAAGLTFSVAWQQAQKAVRSAVPLALCTLTFLMAAWFRTPLWLILLLLTPVGFAWAWKRHA